MMKRLQKSQTCLFAAGVFLAALCLSGFGRSGITARAASDKSLEDYKDVLNYTAEYQDYEEYQAQYPDSVWPEDVYEIEGGDFVRSEGKEAPEILTDYMGRTGKSVYTYDTGMVEYQVDIRTSGMYQLALTYYPVEGNGSSIQRGFFVDGELPYRQMAEVEFSRVWVNSVNEWESDNQGNDLKPTQIEAPEWVTSQLYDVDGYVVEPLSVYLEAGSHTITVVSQREPMVIGSLIIKNEPDTLSYADQLAAWQAAGAKDTAGRTIELQAEYAQKKSSSILYPTQDQSSPAILPYSARALKNNTIGGNGWSHTGQWIEWEFDVPEDGFYNIALHAKQNFVKGIYVSRKIMIDDVVPFSELSHYGFTYDGDWKMMKLSDSEGEAYRFYLTAGRHALKMQVVLGDFAQVVSDVQNVVTKLNSTYRSIIRITGVAPDEYRDYQIEKRLPTLTGNLTEIKNDLDAILAKLDALNVRGSEENVIITMRDQLQDIVKDTEKVTKMVGDFKTNVSALGTWISNAQSQPLQLDAIYVLSPDQGLPKTKNSFLSKLGHEFKKLYYSFIVDYNAIGNIAEEGEDSRTITVWVGSGRDQANVIKALVDETFTPKTNINVNVMLVDMNTLLQASLAGQGPDVALQVANAGGAVVTSSTGTTGGGNDLPVNYGLRSAAVDLSTFPDWEEVASRFRDSALEQFSFDGSLYALPETQNFEMMFYRKDILNELGIEVPKTWDEMKVVISELSKNQMSVGMLPSELTFTSLLFQHGGELYNEEGTKSALDSEASINAFKTYCEYYTDYKLDRATSVEQRFRTGESPIIIADYTTYNVLEVSAPDIKGLWGFTTLPGVEQEDGTINNISASTGLACMMMNGSKDKAAAWEFMKWWLSGDTQTSYGKEMEGLMGEAARYPTANVEAFGNLPWPSDDYEALEAQLNNVKGIRQVPGSYFTWRNVNNAFYAVVAADEDKKMQPREAMNEYIEYINAEITGKRQEFGMATAEDLEEEQSTAGGTQSAATAPGDSGSAEAQAGSSPGTEASSPAGFKTAALDSISLQTKPSSTVSMN